MRRLREKELQFRGEITAFLTFLFVLMLSLVGALLESTSIHMTRNRKRTDMTLALESVFAEYDRKILDEYDLFVRNGCDETVLERRLTYYGAGNMSHNIVRQERLTDHRGKPFREQAIRYAKNWMGLEESPETEGDVFPGERESIFQKEESVETELQGLLAQGGESLPEVDNPLTNVQKLKNTDLISLVSEHPEQLSNRSIIIENLASERALKEGNWGSESAESGTDEVFFVAYLTEHFGDFTNQTESHSLLYEQEYLLGGYPEDKQNLEKVCEKILGIRMAINYAYLLTDSAKQAEAEALALTLCSVLTVPGITTVVKQALLLAWSYGESIVDVRVLLQGKKVPAVKSTETWQLQLANLAKLGTNEEVVGEKDSVMGLSYQSYLKGLFLLENKEVLSMRSLNLIESNLQIRADECMTKAEIQSDIVLRRGVKDTFLTSFKYK